jgi:hypothetical protein
MLDFLDAGLDLEREAFRCGNKLLERLHKASRRDRLPSKAWIDMFGYRMFKVFASLLILLFTQWLPLTINVSQLSWFTLSICVLWISLIMILRSDYRLVAQRSS